MSRFPASVKAKELASEGDRYLYAGQRNEAIRAYDSVLKIEPDCVYVLVQKGLALHENGQPDQAVRSYDKALSVDPNYGPAYYGRSWAKDWKKDYSGEFQDAKKGYQLDPNNPGMYLRRMGAAYKGLKRFSEAIEIYTRAIDLNSRDEGTIYNRGLCYKAMGLYDLALGDLNRALELDPDWDWAFYQRGLVYEEMGKPGEARASFDRALHFNPAYTPAIEALGRLRGKRIYRVSSNRKPAKSNGCIDMAVFILFCLIFSPAMLYLGFSSLYDDISLRDRGRITSATVIDSRIYQGKSGDSYEVKYRFSVDGGKTWYGYSDRTGRKDLWSALPRVQWDIARTTKQTEVKYLPEQPSVNRLVYHDPPSSMWDDLAGVFLGLCPWFIFAILSFKNE